MWGGRRGGAQGGGTLESVAQPGQDEVRHHPMRLRQLRMKSILAVGAQAPPQPLTSRLCATFTPATRVCYVCCGSRQLKRQRECVEDLHAW